MNGMEQSLLTKRLEKVDKELHLIIAELKNNKSIKKLISLEELNKLMEKERVLDIDTTKLIREMRDKEYNL